MPSPTNPVAASYPVDLPLQLEGLLGPQATRVHQALRDAVLAGRLPPGSRLPPSRLLAAQLGVRRNTVVGAYERLLSDGLAEARVGAGTFVARHVTVAIAKPPCLAPAEPPPETASGDKVFALGRTGVDVLFQNRLRRAVGKRLQTLDPVHFAYGDPRGGHELRERVAAHLAVSRGLTCDPGHIVLVSGTQQGLKFCLQALLKPGDAVWMEDPGYPAARRALQTAGAQVVPVPVDEHGLVVETGRRRAEHARVAYVTPSHQFPTGVVMRMHRRVALLAWAREADAWVIEDDYDSEFRYGGPPLTALAGIDAARRVIYLGTFSKVLFPGLRMGYVVLPAPLLEPVLAARAASDRFPPSLLEGAIADLIADGSVSAHVRRMRGRYRAARDAVAETLEAHANGALQVVVPDQGLHLVAYLRPGLPAGAAARIRTAAGISAWLLSETRLRPDAADGFVLGFSGHDIVALRDGAKRLARAAASFKPDSGHA